MKTYKHLTEDERLSIFTRKREGVSKASIAAKLGRHRSTISRELVRNKRKRNSYDPLYAHRKSKRSLASRRLGFSKIDSDSNLKQVIKEKLIDQKRSPDTISGRLRKEQNLHISSQTIYTYIYAHSPELRKYLKYKKGYRRRGVKETRGIVSSGKSIDMRPKHVENRKEEGHREIDTVWSKRGGSGGLLTIVERTSRYCEVAKLETRKSEEVRRETVELLEKYERKKLLSITRDNGKEFALYTQVEEELAIDYYSAHPYASHERGTNEHTNGIIRVHYPKGTDFGEVSSQKIKLMQDMINHKPRKILGYQSPYEVLFDKKLSYF